MTALASTPLGSSRTPRVSLPAVLIIIGIALSCSTACLTTAVVESAQEAARRREVEAQRREITRSLTSIFPTKDGYQLILSGAPPNFTIAAIGNFSPETADAFFAAVRHLYEANLPPQARFDVSIYRDRVSQQTLIAHAIVDRPAVNR